MAGVGAVVVGADEARIVERAGELVREVVAQERVGRIARTLPIGAVQLRVPTVLRDPDVVTLWLQVGAIDLDVRGERAVGVAVGRRRGVNRPDRVKAGTG